MCQAMPYTPPMIKTFCDKALEAFWSTGETRKLSVQNTARLRRILMSLDAATKPEDMNLPSFHFHGLEGERNGCYSVRITGNWRVTLGWENADAINVRLEDYH